MTLGNILKMAADKDFAKRGDTKIVYKEWVDDDNRFNIKLSSPDDKNAYIECSTAYTGKEEDKNILRLHFLSMTFHAGLNGMKKSKYQVKKKW